MSELHAALRTVLDWEWQAAKAMTHSPVPLSAPPGYDHANPWHHLSPRLREPMSCAHAAGVWELPMDKDVFA